MSVRLKESLIRAIKKKQVIRDKNTLKNKDTGKKKRGDKFG